MSSSVFRLLEEAVESGSDRVALSYPIKDEFREMKWAELYKQVLNVSQSLLALGVQVGDRVGVMSKTRVEWTFIDLGVMGVCGCTVPLYHSINDEDFEFMIQDSQASIVFLESVELLTRLRKFRARLANLKYVVILEGASKLDSEIGEMYFLDFMNLGKDKNQLSVIRSRLEEVKPESLASIVYTSGTTGTPKGAMITHDNFLYEAHAIEKLGIISPNEIQLLFLPLAHIFARILQFAWLKTKHTIVFAQDFDHLAENMRVTQPTVLAGVPRVFEKIQARIVEKGLNSPGFKKRIVRWAFNRADEKRKAEMAGEPGTTIAWTISELLVFSEIKSELRKVFGGRLRFLISGGAALSPETSYFFKYAGITILEGWGLTETTAATCLNVPASNRIGTVGKALPGTEVKIAEDGEILVKGRGVFLGYWKNDNATKAAFDAHGYFFSGDIGVLQFGDFLKITDRKKDIIVTASGKKVAPLKLEGVCKNASPLISQIVALGDGKPYVVALFTLDEKALMDFAQENGIKENYAKLTRNPLVRSTLQEKIDNVNAGLASFEQIKRFAILDHDFEIGQQLTPTLKVKRKYCGEKYATVVEKLYKGSASA